MTNALPAGYAWRRPTTDDAASILAVIAAHHTPLIGSADMTLDDVRDELADERFDLAADGWLVADPRGVDVAWAWAYLPAAAPQLDVDVSAADEAVAGWLWDRVLERARQLGAAAGYDEIGIDVGIYEGDTVQRRRAEARGFAPATTFQRMRIDHAGPAADPVVPDGIEVRVGPGDEALRRDGHHVWRAAFAEHYGFADRPFAEWCGQIDALSATDWGQLRVAYAGGAPVAMVRGTNQFVEDEDCGYVATVAVLPTARGRGLAALLLRQAFADDARRGRRATLLHVDTNNVTPALALYHRVGMRPILRVDVWKATVPTAM